MNRNKNRPYSLLVCLGFALGLPPAHAATIDLVPASAATVPGGQQTFSLVAKFGPAATIGGATDLAWDPSVLAFQSFSFSTALDSPVRDPAYDVTDLQWAGLLSIGFGNFDGIVLQNDTVVGSLTFTAVGSPGSSTAITLSDSAVWAGFFDTAGDPIAVDYTGAVAGVSAVPLPAAGWLLLSGVGGLLGLGRRRT